MYGGFALLYHSLLLIPTKTDSERDRFTVQRMLTYQNAAFLPGHAVSSICKQYDRVIMLSKNQSAHSLGSHLHLIDLIFVNNCKLIVHGIKPSGQQ